jgi:hypothetical protein
MSSRLLKSIGGRDGRMFVGFTTTYAISAYHHWICEFESHSVEVYSIQHYVIKFGCDLRRIRDFLWALLVSSTYTTDNHNIDEILLKMALKTITLNS